MNESQLAQKQLGLYCKTGKHEPITSIQENTFHYRRLVFNVVKNTLSNAYPLTVKLLGKETFASAVHFFFENHNCKENQVWKLPFEFYQFFIKNDFPFEHNYPFLEELLLFEWLEIEIFMMPNEEISPFTTQGNIEKDKFIINPELKIQVLHYPLHEKVASSISDKDYGNYFVSVHRNQNDFQVYFNEISYQHTQVLIQLYEQPKSLNDLLPIILEIEPNEQTAKNYLVDFINFSFENQLLLGYGLAQ